jgi:hypothetical protein
MFVGLSFIGKENSVCVTTHRHCVVLSYVCVVIALCRPVLSCVLCCFVLAWLFRLFVCA